VNVLADTSVWITHLHEGLPRMHDLLQDGEVRVHPFVRAEVALGTLRDRAEILGGLDILPSASVARLDEVMALVEAKRLWGRGVGFVDAHLIASALLDDLSLWTLDRPLARAAAAAGVRLVT
jgi:predicted nucleic acid-binding protein